MSGVEVAILIALQASGGRANAPGPTLSPYRAIAAEWRIAILDSTGTGPSIPRPSVAPASASAGANWLW